MTVNYFHTVPSQNLSLFQLICHWYNEKCSVFHCQSDYSDNNRHTLWSLETGPNLPFSTGKVFAEILNFATGDLYSMRVHH